MKIQTSKGSLLLACLLVTPAPAIAVQGDLLAPPPVEVVNEVGINMATGQPTQKLDTVSIGGELGLSHTMSFYANHFSLSKSFVDAYIDKFAGNARYSKVANNYAHFVTRDGILTPEVSFDPVMDGRYLHVMRVFGPAGSHDFKLNSDGATFSPVGDQRHSLRHEIRDGRSTLIWRTPEGIESVYWAPIDGGGLGESGSSGKRDLRTVTYPNGFKVTIEEGAVTTNAGFMLKYGLPKDGVGNSRWRTNPNYIAGINLAIQHCGPDRNTSCETEGWPISHFDWPAAAPLSFLASEGVMNVMKITDQHGGVSEYHYETQNVCRFEGVDLSGLSRVCQSKLPGKEQFSPRLVAVKSANSDVIDFRYSYENDGSFDSVSSGAPGLGLEAVHTYWVLSTKEGLLKSSSHRDRSGGGGRTSVSNGGEYSRSGANIRRIQMSRIWPGVLVEVHDDKRGYFDFEDNARNFVTSHGLSGVTKRYYYDSRGNLEKVTANGVLIQKALYPTSCTNSNFRYCNKPTWTEDANGNRTDYTYHAQSGQVKTVSKPAPKVNGQSIRPKTIYNYDPLYAYYKKDSNTVEQADTPIWLLTSEHTCRTSSTTATGCAGGDMDMVKTEYYYGPQDGSPNNLFLRGMSVTAEGNSDVPETRVNCYEYDQNGNQIAETRPKGTHSLTSCP